MKVLKGLISTLIGIGFLLPSFAFAGTLEITAWIPYWRAERGVTDITPRLSSFTEVNPFLYTVTTDGRLHQADEITDQEWQNLKQSAEEKGLRFVPTVMWANADAMHEVLSDPVKRQAHVKSIASEVYRYGYDGIDIDYEARYARTRDAYTQFHKELNVAIGYDKWIMCTLQSRTPLDSRYSSPESIPADIEYGNDFAELNKYCDRIRVMTYDQGRIDLKLNAENGHPYTPVSDVQWVRKVMNLIAEEVPKEKLLLGIPTYGYEYDTFPSADGSGTAYSRLWSFNPGYATEIASKLNLTPVRDKGGELTLTFPASQSPEPIIPLPNATRLLVWSDAEAINQKLALAEELGIAGASIFKIDDGQDPGIWSVLEKHTAVNQKKKPLDTSSTLAEVPSTVSTSLNLPKVDLEEGDTSEGVRMLQKFLNSKGFTVSSSGGGAPGNETPNFGPKTKDALARFQKAHGIFPAVGYYGPITRGVISSI